jgi:hypothetical protein
MIVGTDLIETTYGRIPPYEVPPKEAYMYGLKNGQLTPVKWGFRNSTEVGAYFRIELNTKPAKYVHLVHNQLVMTISGGMLKASELKHGDKLARFTRIVQHEKYSACRIVPFEDKRQLEHRFVWEAHAEMDVPEGYSIDHIDGDSYNNTAPNLRHMDIRSHSRMTAQRQRFRNTARNADGSFKKAEEKIRIKSADKPIPEHLDLGKLTGHCKVVHVEEIDNTGPNMMFCYIPEYPIVMGGLVVW